MTRREIDATAVEMTWKEGRQRVRATSFFIEEKDACVVIYEDGEHLSAYIEEVPDEDDDDD